MNSTGSLLTEYQIRSYEANGKLELCLDDFVQHIVGSKSVQAYLTKIREKTKRDNLWYKDAEITMSELCPKLRSKKAKEFLEKWRGLHSVETEAGTVEEEVSTTLTSEEEETDTCASFLDIRNNYFQYKGKKVLVVVKDGVVWFKGIDVARLLEIEATAQAIQQIANDDKIAFVRLGVSFKLTLESHKVDPQSIFINQEGMYDLVMSSRKPEAKVFRRWLSHEVLPSINRFGSYSIEKKYGCFYDDHDLYEYDGCNVCYMAYLGVHDGLPLFKYGITFDYYRREYQEHRKTFDLFQLVYLRQTDNNHTIEGLFTKECKSKDVYVQKEFKGKNRTELFTVNELHSFERMRMIMDKLIEQNPTKEHKKYEAEIRQLRQEKDDLSKALSHSNAMVAEVKSHNESLQNDKTILYRMIEALQKEKTTIYQIFENLKQKI